MPVPPSRNPSLPSGWFVAATSAELPRERTLITRFMSEELVLDRTASGEARAISVHPVREQHGMILVYHDPTGGPPSWEVPEIDLQGWSRLVFQKFSLRGHPQEITENGVDVSHFSVVHGFKEVQVLRELCAFGPYLNARYAMKRGFGPLARLGLTFDMEFEVHVYGLGYSRVEVDIKAYGLRSQLFVLSTPTDPGRIDLRLAVSVEEPSGGPVAALLPHRRIADALARFISILYVHDVERDFRIWETKSHLPRPAPSASDGSVGLYRKWARQFYAAEATAD
jgi:hypothetical protein